MRSLRKCRVNLYRRTGLLHTTKPDNVLHATHRRGTFGVNIDCLIRTLHLFVFSGEKDRFAMYVRLQWWYHDFIVRLASHTSLYARDHLGESHEQCEFRRVRQAGGEIHTSSVSTGHSGNSGNMPVSPDGQGNLVSVKTWNIGAGSPLSTTSSVTASMKPCKWLMYFEPRPPRMLALSPSLTWIAKLRWDGS